MTRDEAIAELIVGCELAISDPAGWVMGMKRPDDTFIQAAAVRLVWKDGRKPKIVVMTDLPAQLLDEEQTERARRFFAANGHGGPLNMPCTYDGKTPATISTWALDCGNDPALAAEKLVETFEAIYEPPPYPEYEVDVFESQTLEKT